MSAGDLDRRLQALAAAVELAEGRLEREPVDTARGVVRRAGERLGLGVEATVAALLGPTGSGKSSLFNALAGAQLVEAGRLRPTTSTATAAVWGQAPQALLDWLDVRLRHGVGDGDGAGDGLVLLDLPDFDSVQHSHRLEVDRLVELVDLLVWVVDPQKYADAALHERYLRPLAAHGGSMVLVLNQADLLAPDALAACRRDLVGLLAADGLPDVPVLTVSARSGEGVSELSGLLTERVARRAAAVERLSADVETAAADLARRCGDSGGGRIDRRDRQRLVAALADAAGVPTVVRAVDRAHRRRGALAAGWPLLRWARRLRPDPLRRLRVGEGSAADGRTSLPGPTPVQRSQVSSAARSLAAGAAEGMSDPWPALVRSAATAREDEVADRLDRAVAGAELPSRRPRWWAAAGLLQRALAAAALAGALWLLVLAALGYLHIEDVVPLPDVRGIPVPTALLLGGLLGGLVLGALARVVNGVGARRRARAATRALHRRVEDVAQALVSSPVEAELAAHERLRATLAEARSDGGSRRRRSRSPVPPVAAPAGRP